MPRRLLIKIAEEIYRIYKTAPYDGFTSERFIIVTKEIEPGINPDDYLEAVKQIQRQVKSIKEARPMLNEKDPTDLERTGPNVIWVSIDEDGKMKPINLTVDPEKFKDELLKFIKNTYARGRLISQDEDGIFWFRANQEMIPKMRDSNYWKIFESIYDVAMRGSEDENHYFLAEYKPLRSALVKRKVITNLTTSDDRFRQMLRNFIKDQFNKRPHSLGLPQSMYHGKEIVSIEEKLGVKLYNPEL